MDGSIQVTITNEEDVLLNCLRLSWRSDLFSSRLEISQRVYLRSNGTSLPRPLSLM
jgi:hypothetical protein